MPHGRPAKRRRLTPPLDDSAVSETVKSSDLFNRAADWDLEEDYAQRSRQKRSKESHKLPIKTAEGRVERLQESLLPGDDSDSFLGSDSEDEKGRETPPTDEPYEPPAVPKREQILAAKEELARIAGLLNEDPEEHAGSFKKLAQVGAASSHTVIQKLALAAQVAVYKDVIPGYRIRAYKDEDLGTKVSKEIRTTRQYEQALVAGYQGYVKQLIAITKSRSSNIDQASLRSVAIGCACALLLAVPHFNFRTELLSIIVREIAGRDLTPEYCKCIETIEKFFAEDDDGAPSLEAVTLLTKMLKNKDYRVREEVPNTFFSLRLLSELSANSSAVNPESRKRIGSQLHGRKIKKEKWEHRSKKERKVARERKAVEKDFREADATVNYEEREKVQSETLKLVFITYFRILKARVPGLMGAVLEGLAKYAHLINQDLFGDILEALKDIINQIDAFNSTEDGGEIAEETIEDLKDVRNRTRESLLSTQTAFTLLSGQEVSKSASTLHLDLSFFTSHIYRTLYALALDADIELGPKSLHLADPHSSSSTPSTVNISTPVLLLTRVLNSILLTPSQPPPTVTALSFYKRLLSASLQLPEKSAIAILDLMTKLAEKHGRKIEPLWFSDERKGDGVFRGESESVEGTNAFAVGSGVWEGELLRNHYCPTVREGVVAIDKIVANLHR